MLDSKLVYALQDRIQQLQDAGLEGQAVTLYNNAQERFGFSHDDYSAYMRNMGIGNTSPSDLKNWSQSNGPSQVSNQLMTNDAMNDWISKNISSANAGNVINNSPQQPSAPALSAAQQYFNQYPDIAAAYQQNSYGMTPDQFAQTHYERFGQTEGRTFGGQSGTDTGSGAAIAAPAAQSPWQSYLSGNRDVQQAFDANSYGMTPQQFAEYHYLNYGKGEGRQWDGQAPQGTGNTPAQPTPTPSPDTTTTGGGEAPRPTGARTIYNTQMKVNPSSQNYSSNLIKSLRQDEYNLPSQPQTGVNLFQPVTESTSSYFASNPDVSSSYSENNYGMTPDQFAQTHYDRYGQAEGRSYGSAPQESTSGATGAAAFAKGGSVTKNRLAGPDPKGPDDGYAALDSGEYVIKKAAVGKYGKKLLEQINALRYKD